MLTLAQTNLRALFVPLFLDACLLACLVWIALGLLLVPICRTATDLCRVALPFSLLIANARYGSSGQDAHNLASAEHLRADPSILRITL
jgi:hypothetical protein